MCSIHSMVEGNPSHTGFTQWWGAPHLQHSLNDKLILNNVDNVVTHMQGFSSGILTNFCQKLCVKHQGVKNFTLVAHPRRE